MNEEQAKLELARLRNRIDEVDRKLVEFLNERTRVVEEIGAVKRTYKLPVYEPKREDEVYLNIAASNHGPLPHDSAKRIFERIIDEMRTVQRNRMNKEGV